MSQVTKLGPGGYSVPAQSSGPRVLTLACSPGSYAITGDSAALLATHILNASPGSYLITGASAQLLHNYPLKASPGSYTITGASALLGGIFTLLAAPGAYRITGASANLAYKQNTVKFDLGIGRPLTKKQLEAIRKAKIEGEKRRFAEFAREGESRSELRKHLETLFGVAEPEQAEHIEKIKESLPVKVAEVEKAAQAKPAQFTKYVDWPKLYDDRALLDGLTRDLGKILADHLERQRFEQEEDDLAILMMA